MYVDLAGLARYKGNFGAWARGALLPKDAAAARVRTEKAGAVSFVPVQRTPLDVSVDFLFSETPPASGDKGPENPSTISSVSSVKVTRCGKNLAELNRVYALSGRGIAVSVNADGSIHAAGTVGSAIAIVDIGNHDDSANKQLPYWMEVGKTYTLSFSSSNANGNPRASIYLPNSLTAWGSPHLVYSGESYTFTVDSTIKRALIRIIFDANSTVNCDCYIQIEEGSSATSFDGTIPDVYTLPLGSTYYGGTLDVASGVMTVTYEGHVFNGTEPWRTVSNSDGTNFRHDLASSNYQMNRHAGSGTCSHFQTTAGGMFRYYASGMFGDMFFVVIEDPNAVYGTNDAWLSFLAAQYANGTPVTICYKLYEPQIVQLSPTEILSLTQSSVYDPRLNTVYGDAQAVQVGYLKHPSAASADLRGALVSLGGGV